ncbi:hypothetical protein MHIB_36920 [Mycolicibacter hiberniae]|uniref:Uncharacterized protein n=1 Tax=Mycolicibacter hiberniae TaxID=29314 RepID=A0A7I7X6T7_9MYCO|nr:hypothetical protein MHIB_36920 [Mycolicibacter hiberniae]
MGAKYPTANINGGAGGIGGDGGAGGNGGAAGALNNGTGNGQGDGWADGRWSVATGGTVGRRDRHRRW